MKQINTYAETDTSTSFEHALFLATIQIRPARQCQLAMLAIYIMHETRVQWETKADLQNRPGKSLTQLEGDGREKQRTWLLMPASSTFSACFSLWCHPEAVGVGTRREDQKGQSARVPECQNAGAAQSKVLFLNDRQRRLTIVTTLEHLFPTPLPTGFPLPSRFVNHGDQKVSAFSAACQSASTAFDLGLMLLFRANSLGMYGKT